VLDWPVAVVIDGTAAGAAEIVAGALQDHDRALLVGRTTFGLASAQSDFPLEGGSASVRFTTTVQLTPSGRPIQRLPRQISDDEEDVPDADSAATDTATRRAYLTHAGRKVLAGGGIRPDLDVPVDSTAALAAARSAPVDDALLRRALAVLRRAHAPRDVFAAAALHAAAPVASAPEERRR
jgi:carboxyl-terminal processing protease